MDNLLFHFIWVSILLFEAMNNHVDPCKKHATLCCPLLFIYKRCSFYILILLLMFLSHFLRQAVTFEKQSQCFSHSSGFCHCLCVWALQRSKPEPPCVPVHRRGGHCPLPSASSRHTGRNRTRSARPGTCRQWTLPLDDWDWWGKGVEWLSEWWSFSRKTSLRY